MGNLLSIFNVGDLLSIFKGVYTEGARVYNSAAIATADSVLTTLTFDTERYDTDSIHDLATNTGRLTCKTAGKYLITTIAEFAFNATGRRQVYIKLNGTTYIGALIIDPCQVVAGTTMTATCIYDLAVNDYVECQVYQTSGGALNINASGNTSPEFMMQRIG